MRTVRICLLILLAVLLPVRGAMAAVMLCPPAATVGTVGVDAPDPHAMHAGHGDPAAPHHGDAPPSSSASGQHDGFGTCNLCCDFCGVTLWLNGLPGVPAPPEGASGAFPPLAAQAPSFLSGGQERPPRTC